MKHLSVLLLLFNHLSPEVSAGEYSKTLSDWCQSDHLIGDPKGLAKEKRFNSKDNTCTQTFGIFDKRLAALVCSQKMPFRSSAEFDEKKGVTCKWETNVRCPGNSFGLFNECIEVKKSCAKPYTLFNAKHMKYLTIILRNQKIQAVAVKVKGSVAKQVLEGVGYGANGFLRSPDAKWSPALVIPSEPMLAVPAGSLMKANVSESLCKVDPERGSGSEKAETKVTRNVYQPNTTDHMNNVDISKFHEICEKICEGCYAAYEKKGEKRSYYVPVRRKEDKRHSEYEKCKDSVDIRQTKQFFLQSFPGGDAMMANDQLWSKEYPNENCADAPRSSAIFSSPNGGWTDVPPFARACLVCTNERLKATEGVVECALNSKREGKQCNCLPGFVDVNDLQKDWPHLKEKKYDKGMYCLPKCDRNSGYEGVSCQCREGFTTVHDIPNEFEEEKRKFRRGEFCEKKIDCGENASPDYKQKTCVCNAGHLKWDEDEGHSQSGEQPKLFYCVKKRKCKQNSRWTTGNKCKCNADHINVADTALPEAFKYKEEDGFCIRKVKCGNNAHEVKPNGKTLNICHCDDGFVDAVDEDPAGNAGLRGQTCMTTTTTTTERPKTPLEKCENLQADSHFVFVVDSSGSIGEAWPQVKTFVSSALEYLPDPAKTTLTFIIFSSGRMDEFQYLPGKWSRSRVDQHIQSLSLRGGYTWTKEAIQRAYQVHDNDRTSTVKMIVLITDGIPLKEGHGELYYQEETISAVQELHNRYPKVRVIGIGIGGWLIEPIHRIDGKVLRGPEIIRALVSNKQTDYHEHYSFDNLKKELMRDALYTACKTIWG